MFKCSKTKNCLICMCGCIGNYAKKISFLPNFIVRLYLAEIFLNSGMAKLDDWKGTLFLFQYEYSVPVINYAVAAYIALTMELVGSVFLAIGFGTRLVSLALFVMTLIMNFSYVESTENYYWMLLFSMLFVYGGSKLSVDYWLKNQFLKGKHKNC
ncbi:MAG: DoxX family protein [Rickettsiales bacterium]